MAAFRIMAQPVTAVLVAVDPIADPTGSTSDALVPKIAVIFTLQRMYYRMSELYQPSKHETLTQC